MLDPAARHWDSPHNQRKGGMVARSRSISQPCTINMVNQIMIPGIAYTMGIPFTLFHHNRIWRKKIIDIYIIGPISLLFCLWVLSMHKARKCFHCFYNSRNKLIKLRKQTHLSCLLRKLSSLISELVYRCTICVI